MGFHHDMHVALLTVTAQTGITLYCHAVCLRKIDNQAIGHDNTLKFHGMDLFVTIIHGSLIFIWSGNSSNCPINKPKTVL